MKFTDGYWLMRPEVHAVYATEVDDVRVADDTMTVYAPIKTVRGRGDTLNSPLLTIAFSSPMADVVRVKLTNYAGARPALPQFELHANAAENVSIETTDEAVTLAAENVSIETTDEAVTLISGRLSVRVARTGPWRVDFLGDDRLLTQSGFRAMGSIEVDGQGHFMHEQLNLGVGENVYGLGERFTSFVKNGQVVDIWNRDGGTGSEQAYKNVPFYLTNRGYGVFVNDPGLVSFEVASEKVSRVQFSVSGQSLEYFVIYGPTPKEILAKYTALTGRPALPPAWSFGLWLTTSFTTNYDEATVTSFIQGMADRDLPLHVFHFDCFWMREYQWCDFEWDPRTFPDPKGMLERLKARGLKICVWINSYIGQRSPLFAEAEREGYLIKRPNGDVWQWDLWQAGMGVVDFTNPAAREWYASKLRALLEMGVDCFKTDFGERIPTDVVYFDGSNPQRMHNYYTQLFNKTVFDLLREVRGEGEAVLFARSATAGGQQFPVHWGGDCDSTFESMAESLRGGLSLGLSGFGFWSHDIGGFEGMPRADVYKRWIAFGLLSSHSRLHGSSSYRVPWLFDEEAVDVLRFFTRLKGGLMPYLFRQALVAHAEGTPVMRAMLLEFPNDPACYTLDRQYMLGGSLLVAPVFSETGEVEYYVPAGRWTKYLTGETIEGPRWVQETHSFLSAPLLVRPNSVIAVGAQTDLPDYDYAAGVTLQAYEVADSAQITVDVPTPQGDIDVQFVVSRAGNTIRVSRNGSAKPWRLLLVGVSAVANVSSGVSEKHALGTLVALEADVDTLTITL